MEPLPPTATGRVAELWRWPVKSMAGERLRASRMDPRGLAGDRTHAVAYDHKGAVRALSARQSPGLLHWAATYPDAPDDAVGLDDPPPPRLRDPTGAEREWDDPALPGALQADLGRAVELRRLLGGQQDLERSVLVTTEATRAAVEADLGRPIDLRRFRPNLHLELDAPAWAEAGWTGGRIVLDGGLELELLHPCQRCGIPARDPDTGERWPDFLRWLFGRHGGAFGINARACGPGRVAAGAEVRVLAP